MANANLPPNVISTCTLRFAALMAIGVGTTAFAMAGAGVAGTKAGGDFGAPSGAGSTVGFGALAQMILALAIVAFLLRWVLPKVAGKVTKKLVTSVEGGIRIEESAQFAGGALYIISARGKSLLVSVAGASVTTLTEFTPGKPDIDPFETALAVANTRAAPGGAELEARIALDRLTQLTAGHAR